MPGPPSVGVSNESAKPGNSSWICSTSLGAGGLPTALAGSTPVLSSPPVPARCRNSSRPAARRTSSSCDPCARGSAELLIVILSSGVLQCGSLYPRPACASNTKSVSRLNGRAPISDVTVILPESAFVVSLLKMHGLRVGKENGGASVGGTAILLAMRARGQESNLPSAGPTLPSLLRIERSLGP